MNGVYLISRHREWRAWKFGMRHSGAMSGGVSGGDNDDFWRWVECWPRWVKVTVLCVFSGSFIVLMLINPLLLFKALMWLILIFIVLWAVAYVVLSIVVTVRSIIDWLNG